MGGYLNRIGTVKYSHNWPVKGSPPGNPEEDAYIKKEVILHKSLFVFFSSSRLLFHRFGCESGWRCLPPFVLSPLHWGGVSPTISMPCCWSCARSNAFSFFSSSILRTKKKKKNLINNIFIPVTA